MKTSKKNGNKAKKNTTIIFPDTYLIVYKAQRPDGYWNTRMETMVHVPLVGAAADNEKNNHDLAEKLFKEKFPNAIVLSVTYV